ncbi:MULTISPECIES: ABC transporter substrate-binding protein [Massilia]|uniref:ABC transporter substrate-binding protein n=2 Tax=Massilia TaxID=149698 RepID=A0ACC7M534_9BURK|nr:MULTISPECIES: ABC transporter substrate-binding protein [Telluria group]KQY00880.1 sugar ABC transporter substrate-binding protein [Massilia sp. Root133]MDN4043769.1 ABC transporter substrate-binding protein [Massilia sp. YIM B02787]MVW63643.1 extracellular solute-binding protein [Telluria cellulosilytica]
MYGTRRALLCASLCAWLCATASAAHGGPRAEVIHWWTSGGESAAVKQVEQAYRDAGGTWVDTAIAGGDQSRAVTINRIIGGNPPTAAQFNTSKQFLDIIEEDLLNPVDDLARRDRWDQVLPAPIVDVIKVRGHWYAVPMNIHMQTWIWYSKAAFAKAGITREPATMDELFAALDKLKAAGVIPLAHGGQAWQDILLFSMVLSNMGGRELYLKVIRDRDQAAIRSAEFRKVLVAYKRLQGYVDPASPGRNWNDATALVIGGKAGMQIMGDWAKGEFIAAGQAPGRQFGCLPGLGADSPYLIQGDVFVFPKTDDAGALRAQKLLASVVENPGVQLAFNKLKGSVPVRLDADDSQFDACARKGMAILRDPKRPVGVAEVYLTPDQNGALQDVLTAYWNTSMPVERAQNSIASALRY